MPEEDDGMDIAKAQLDFLTDHAAELEERELEWTIRFQVEIYDKKVLSPRQLHVLDRMYNRIVRRMADA